MIFPIKYAALSFKPYLSIIAIAGKIIKKIDINLLFTNDSPNILKTSIKSIPDTNPVTIPETMTTASTSNFSANPTTIITIPINLIYSIFSPPVYLYQKQSIFFK